MSNCDLSVLSFSNNYPMMEDKFVFMTRCVIKRNFEINRAYLGLPEHNTKVYNQTIKSETCQHAIHNLLKCFNRLKVSQPSTNKYISEVYDYHGVSIDERFINTSEQKNLFDVVLKNCELMKEKKEFTRKYNMFN